jgi:hypothetical protein
MYDGRAEHGALHAAIAGYSLDRLSPAEHRLDVEGFCGGLSKANGAMPASTDSWKGHGISSLIRTALLPVR